MAPIVTHILPYEGDVIVLKNSVSTVFKLSSSLAELRGEERRGGHYNGESVGVETGGHVCQCQVSTCLLIVLYR